MEDPQSGFWGDLFVAMEPAVPFLWLSFSGFMITSFYQAFNFAYNMITRRVYCSITIRSNDEIYKIV